MIVEFGLGFVFLMGAGLGIWGAIDSFKKSREQIGWSGFEDIWLGIFSLGLAVFMIWLFVLLLDKIVYH